MKLSPAIASSLVFSVYAADAVSTLTDESSVSIGETCNSPAIYFEPDGVIEEETLNFVFADLRSAFEGPWTNEQETLFDELAAREALGTISEIERQQLENLSAIRYANFSPRSLEEVAQAAEIKQETEDAIQALNRLIARFS